MKAAVHLGNMTKEINVGPRTQISTRSGFLSNTLRKSSLDQEYEIFGKSTFDCDNSMDEKYFAAWTCYQVIDSRREAELLNAQKWLVYEFLSMVSWTKWSCLRRPKNMMENTCLSARKMQRSHDRHVHVRRQAMKLAASSSPRFHATLAHKRDGSWNRVAELMMLTIRESGHLVFRGTSAVARGPSTWSTGGGTTLTHWNADTTTSDILHRIIVSVNQFSINGQSWIVVNMLLSESQVTLHDALETRGTRG